MRDVLGNHFKGPIIPFGSLIEYHPINFQGPVQESINLERKSFLDCSSGYALYAGGIWKG